MMPEILAASLQSGCDEGRMEHALSPKTNLEIKKTQKKSLLSQMPTCDWFTN